MYFDILYNPTENDFVKVQELGIEYGFKWSDNDRSYVRFHVHNDLTYIVFTVQFNGNNDVVNKVMYSFGNHSFRDTEDFLKTQLLYNSGNYCFVDNISDLEYTLINNKPKIKKFKLENPKDRLVYEENEALKKYDVIVYKVKNEEEFNDIQVFLISIGFKWHFQTTPDVVIDEDRYYLYIDIVHKLIYSSRLDVDDSAIIGVFPEMSFIRLGVDYDGVIRFINFSLGNNIYDIIYREPKNKLVYENKNDIILFDIFYFPKTDDEVFEVYELGKSFGFGWGYKDIEKILDLNHCNCFIFSFENGEKNIYVYSEILELSPEYIINDNISVNKGNYAFVNDITELTYSLKYMKKPFIYSKVNKNIYEKVEEMEPYIVIYNIKEKEDEDKIRLEIDKCVNIAYSNDYNDFCFDIKVDTLKSFIYHNDTKSKYILDCYDTNEGILKQYNNIKCLVVDNIKNLENVLRLGKIEPYYMKKNELVYENDVQQIIKFNDFDNLEYRKGSQEYGGILIKLLEFLRLYKTEDIISFKLNDFISKSNITIEEIQKLIESKDKGQKLYDFDILIEKGIISFSNLNKTGKNRPFESNNS